MREQRREQHDSPVAERFDQQPGKLARLRVDRGGEAHRRGLEPVAFVIGREAALGSLAQRAVERVGFCIRRLHAFPKRGRDPPDQAVVQLGGEVGLRELSRFGNSAPPAFGDQHRHRPRRDHAIGVLDETVDQARPVGIVGRVRRQRVAEQFLPHPRHQLAHQLGVAQQARAREPRQHGGRRIAERLRQRGFAPRAQQTRAMLANLGLDRVDQPAQQHRQRRAGPLVEPRFLGQKEVVDRDHQALQRRHVGASRTRKQLLSADGGAIAHVDRVVRHVPRLAEVSLRRD